MKIKQILLILLSALFAPALLYSQQSEINLTHFDFLKLEHLVKEKVDQVRVQYNCNPLANDSILYLAASHHSDYMRKNERISHNEDKSKTMRTPQDRAIFFGAVNYGVGENVMNTTVNANVKGKNNVNFVTTDYEELAKAIVHAWVNSPGHFKNIISPEYEITGVSVSVDSVTKKVYACQKFAEVYYKYRFTENKKMFPYSNYRTADQINNFDNTQNTLIPYEYPYNLTQDNKAICASCDEITENKPFITLRFERNSFILRIENAAYAKQLLKNRKDGFAVEIVTFDDYMCGNSEYFTKPSRRNGQLLLNGKTLPPRYTKDLYPGYKKRKKRSEVKFIPYIFKSDSISFFKRFGRYKVDRYDHQYFEINLGRLPKNQTSFWNHNLVYIQNNQICHIDYFTGYCGELIQEKQPVEFIPASSEGEYSFELDKQQLKFRIPYEQGDVEFTNEKIAPFIKSLDNHSYQIDSIHINAYASVEGDSILNHKIQLTRAKNIAKILQNRQDTQFRLSIQSKTDWEHFRKFAGSNPKWKYLNQLTNAEVINRLKTLDTTELAAILSRERRSEIEVFCTVKYVDDNLPFYINRDIKRINDTIRKKLKKRLSIEKQLRTFDELYGFAHHLTVTERITKQFFATIRMPYQYGDDHNLAQKFVMFGLEYQAYFYKNKQWIREYEDLQKYIIGECKNHKTPEFIYHESRLLSEQFSNGKASLKGIQNVLNNLSNIPNFYNANEFHEKNIDNLNFNLNIALLNDVFQNEPLKYSDQAMNSIAQLYRFYEKYNQLSGTNIVNLAKCAVFFDDIKQAVNILTPYAKKDTVLAYLIPLGYTHPSHSYSEDYYQRLIQLSSSMDKDIWCSMFLSECKIPFQALDHKKLRDTFCSQCMDSNEIILQLLGPQQMDSN